VVRLVQLDNEALEVIGKITAGDACTLIVRIDSELGDSVALMAGMGFFALTGDRYQMVLPSALNDEIVRGAALALEHPLSWARHLLAVRDLQMETGGFTEVVPLPFVHMEAPMYLRGAARGGPTFREAVLMHAVARLALHPRLANIQTSWVKMGPQGAAACLKAGANDLGGTLMN